ncbi:MAG: hypothetical protein IJW77_10070 [Clostridia bacterium]|nr:hypothetical protein [Clostridia bacterium]
MYSSVKDYRGVPTLFVEGKPIPGFAYMTYRTYNSRYDAFASLGCTLFSMPVFFGTQTINETSQIPPMAEGIFEGDEPDFSGFDADVRKILSACPGAYIFPRVNLSLPRAWEDAHPAECCDFAFPGGRHRACFSSDAWAEETKRLLGIFIDHIEASDCREHIVGYQLAGGNTEEWFPFDMRGSVGLRSREAFAKYCAEHGLAGNDTDQRRFYSDMMVRRILEFSAFAKEKTERRLVIGCFYGYTMECPAPEHCHHALGTILASDDVDFLCSPISYANLRPAGMDHANMLPIDSVKLHGKLYFVENDTRTHLSRAPNELPQYNTPIWFGPAPEQTCENIRMHFSRALTHGHAMWWFDMWGGWYDDERYLSLLRRCREIAAESMEEDRTSRAEIAVFIDERAYSREGSIGHLSYAIRKTLGMIGAPYDIYLIDDYEAAKTRYNAHIFIQPAPTVAVHDAVADAAESALLITPAEMEITADAIRDFCAARGVHIYCPDTVVYGCGSYLFLHACRDGAHTVSLPGGLALRDLFSGERCGGAFDMKLGESRLFALEPLR